MFITLTNHINQEILVNPNHIQHVEPAGGESTDSKVFFFSRAEIRVKQTFAEIRALCGDVVIETPSPDETQAPAFVPGPSEVKSTDADFETAAILAETPRGRKTK